MISAKSFFNHRISFPAFLFFALTLPLHTKACLNDTGIQSAEEEFRSRYDAPAPDPTEKSKSPPVASYAALAIGGGLIAGTVVTGVKRRTKAE